MQMAWRATASSTVLPLTIRHRIHVVVDRCRQAGAFKNQLGQRHFIPTSHVREMVNDSVYTIDEARKPDAHPGNIGMRLAERFDHRKQGVIERPRIVLERIDDVAAGGNLSVSDDGRFDGGSPEIDPDGSTVFGHAEAGRGSV
jgi:hypothetical protein